MRIVGIISIALVCGSTAGWAQTNEDEQKQACMGDAFKFCASHIPDRAEVARCLSANHDQISPACRGLMDAGRTSRTRRNG